MKRALAVLLLGFVGLIGGLVPSVSSAQEKKPCVLYWGESKYVQGYDHLVHVVNTCSEQASCVLTTSVNPKPEIFDVQPGEHRVITTWRGSPAATFVIYLDCKLPEGS